jgi:hypothetical protein
MLHTSNPIIKHKAGLLNLAEELGNVSRACKVMGVPRDTFYRYRELVDDGGIDNLINKSRRAPNTKKRVVEKIEQAVIAYVIEQPAHDQHRASNELRRIGIFVSGCGVRSIWLRNGLEKFTAWAISRVLVGFASRHLSTPTARSPSASCTRRRHR